MPQSERMEIDGITYGVYATIRFLLAQVTDMRRDLETARAASTDRVPIIGGASEAVYWRGHNDGIEKLRQRLREKIVELRIGGRDLYDAEQALGEVAKGCRRSAKANVGK